jgi:hypothetical protein
MFALREASVIGEKQIQLAAAAIANARAARHGAPAVSNVLEMLGSVPRLQNLLAEVREDAEVALEAVGLPRLLADKDRLEWLLSNPSTVYANAQIDDARERSKR